MSRMRVNGVSLMGFARGSIDADAEKVVLKLARSGYKAYLVGGCVRDLLLERTPKDFDVATSATPSDIRELFRNCRIIGRRFRLAHIFFGSKIIETSTFRANPSSGLDSDDELLIRRDNVFGSATEDARRRDFTVNGLFYDVETREVIDYVGGLADLEARLVRTIGPPEIRLQEDPVRMLRAIKFAARLDFEIEPATYRALVAHRTDIKKCAPPRVLEEFYRLLRGGAARRSMALLNQTGIDEVLSPRLAEMFRSPGSLPQFALPADDEEAAWHATWADEYQTDVAQPGLALSFLSADELVAARAVAWRMLDQLDAVSRLGHECTNAFLLAALINPFLVDHINRPGTRVPELTTMIDELAEPLFEPLRVPRRELERMRNMLLMQRRLDSGRRRRARSPVARRESLADTQLLAEMTRRAKSDRLPPEAGLRELVSAQPRLVRDEWDAGERRGRRRGGRRRWRRGQDAEA